MITIVRQLSDILHLNLTNKNIYMHLDNWHYPIKFFEYYIGVNIEESLLAYEKVSNNPN